MDTFIPELGAPMRPMLEAIIKDFSTLERGSEAHSAALRVFRDVIDTLSDRVDAQRADIADLRARLAALTLPPVHPPTPTPVVTQGHALLSSGGIFYTPKQSNSVTVHFVRAMPHPGYTAVATLFATTRDELNGLQVLGITTQSSYSVTVQVKNVGNVPVHAGTARVNVVAIMG